MTKLPQAFGQRDFAVGYSGEIASRRDSGSGGVANPSRLRVAIVGGGIAGLGAALALRDSADATLFEAAPSFGGHAHTVDVTLDGVTHGVDTGFLVFNPRTYPQLIELFGQLQVPVATSEMSFSVQVPQGSGRRRLEWSGSNLNTVFCQRANVFRPGFWRMLRDLRRFNATATLMAQTHDPEIMGLTLGDFLDAQRFSQEFRNWYLLPMLACIWSCPTDRMLRFPVATVARFCHNHGLLQIADRPQWQTVRSGSRAYVERIVERLPDARAASPVLCAVRDPDGQGVAVLSRHGWESFDRLILATHSDQARQLLTDADPDEISVLDAVKYQTNHAVLHTDASVLPRDHRAWAAWNYEAGPLEQGQVCLHYLINRLQPLPWQRPVIVSLNPLGPIAAEHVLGEFKYAHPVLDAGAVDAQGRLARLQGRRNTWFCGAWTGYGFHEDGLASGRAAARAVLASTLVDHLVAQPA